MLLTNFLPAQGNGMFNIHAFATDKEGHQILLGTRSVTCDNTHAVKPFGTIDTPAQGGTSSGVFFNFGWVLTPLPATVPIDGSTITVWVDSVQVGALNIPPSVYNQYRADVAGNFPDFNNTNGAVGAYYFDTTGYANGVHTIWWIAYDNAGQGDGIGSRYFTIANVGGSPQPEAQPRPSAEISAIPLSFGPIMVKTGYDLNAEFRPVFPDANGILEIEISEVNRLEIELGDEPEAASALKPGLAARIEGYLIVGDELRPLPIGSTLDRRAGRFSWMPGPGFVGTYDLIFIQMDGVRTARKIPIRVLIKPKSK
jgi:hypothetical protein